MRMLPAPSGFSHACGLPVGAPQQPLHRRRGCRVDHGWQRPGAVV